MGRNITQSAQIERSLITALDNFGTGQVKLFTNNDTFVVPEGITVVRARCFGGGGGGYFGGNGTAGGTSSFGVFCSATGGGGGTGTTPWFGSGGTGIGGDINRTGGNGGGSSSNPGGGGGVAGLFTNGGIGTTGASPGNGNAGGGGVAATGAKGGDGILGKGAYYTTATADSFLATENWINLSIDFLGCGGGGAGPIYGPTNGGGGVGNTVGNVSARGAWPGGGGGGGGATSQGGGGGGGFTIKTIIVTPGDFIAVTVGAGGTSGTTSPPSCQGASGCVVVEY